MEQLEKLKKALLSNDWNIVVEVISELEKNNTSTARVLPESSELRRGSGRVIGSGHMKEFSPNLHKDDSKVDKALGKDFIPSPRRPPNPLLDFECSQCQRKFKARSDEVRHDLNSRPRCSKCIAGK